ncbi:hypothetical protein DL768_006712 [Monosporascus sp. mg162]|nr:hypothetical protein DL768_006712 [Monosporascus sp. mg162]
MPFRAQRAAAARARAVRVERLAAKRAPADGVAVAAEPEFEPEFELEPKRKSTSTPAASAALTTSARLPRQRSAQSARCAELYLDCLYSAFAGRFNGLCYDAAIGSRC